MRQKFEVGSNYNYKVLKGMMRIQGVFSVERKLIRPSIYKENKRHETHKCGDNDVMRIGIYSAHALPH